jgi:hypothetical protein
VKWRRCREADSDVADFTPSRTSSRLLRLLKMPDNGLRFLPKRLTSAR